MFRMHMGQVAIMIFSDEQKIKKEIQTLAAKWKSNKARRSTVERRLEKSGMQYVHKKIQIMINEGKLIRYPTRTGDYLFVK
jgi:hypothetical protein